MAHRFWQHCGQFHDYSTFALCSSICSLLPLIRRHLTCRNTSLFMTLPTQCTFHQLFGSALENANTSSKIQPYWTLMSLQGRLCFCPWSILLISTCQRFGLEESATRAVTQCSEMPLKHFWRTLSSRALDGCSGSISFRRLDSANGPAQRKGIFRYLAGAKASV